MAQEAIMRDFTSTPAEPEGNPLAGLSFTLDGEVFNLEGQVSAWKLSRMARDGRRDEGAEAAMLAESFHMALGQGEYDRFCAHCEKHDTPDEVILAITSWITERAQERSEQDAGRPTRRRPSSPSGPPDPAERMSRVISLQRGDVQIIAEEDPKTGKQAQRPVPQDRKPKSGRARRAG